MLVKIMWQEIHSVLRNGFISFSYGEEGIE